MLIWVLKLNLLKKIFCTIKSRYYCLYLKKKTSCVSLSIYIFSHLTYKMKDKINSQVSFPYRSKNAICCVKWLKNVKHKTSYGNSKCVKKFQGLTALTRPPAVFYRSRFALALWETQSSIWKMARVISA